MEAINYISQWTNYLLYVVPSLAIVMIGYEGLKMTTGSEEGYEESKDKIKKILIAAIFVEISLTLINVVKGFF